MMQFKTDGLVIKVSQTGEADRIVTAITRERGLIRAFAKSAKRPKNKLHAGTQMLCYSNFDFFLNKDTYTINDAECREIFFGLRDSIEKLSLSHYFCELAGVFTPEDENAEQQLRLTLNSLHMLDKNKKDMHQLKAIMELRMMSDAGYMPNLVGCELCGEHESPHMFFNLKEGRLYCDNCVPPPGSLYLDLSIVTALRHIVFSQLSSLYAFTLNIEGYRQLSEITEEFMLNFVTHKFATLDFYKSVSVLEK